MIVFLITLNGIFKPMFKSKKQQGHIDLLKQIILDMFSRFGIIISSKDMSTTKISIKGIFITVTAPFIDEFKTPISDIKKYNIYPDFLKKVISSLE